MVVSTQQLLGSFECRVSIHWRISWGYKMLLGRSGGGLQRHLSPVSQTVSHIQVSQSMSQSGRSVSHRSVSQVSSVKTDSQSTVSQSVSISVQSVSQ